MKKDSKSLKVIKKGFKSNEIVIYAIALMLVTAGYLNYTTNFENHTIETASEQVNENIIENVTSEISAQDEINDNETKEDDDIGDAKLVNSNSTDYFVSTKLERDTNYADMISTYTKILEDKSVSETQKSIAMTEITKINNTKNAISICENLLSTKGFSNYVVLVNSDNINVVVQIEGGLTKEKVAQIQNIISREFKSKIENIHITEK